MYIKSRWLFGISSQEAGVANEWHIGISFLPWQGNNSTGGLFNHESTETIKTNHFPNHPKARFFDLHSRIPYAGPVQILDGVEVDGVYRPEIWKCQRTTLKKKIDFRK